MKGTRKVPAWTICTILAAISCGVYLNTLQAGFTFDDFFAVVGNHYLLISIRAALAHVRDGNGEYLSHILLCTLTGAS